MIEKAAEEKNGRGHLGINSSIPRDRATICLKCIQRDANHRYFDARKVAQQLRRFPQGEPIRARPLYEMNVDFLLATIDFDVPDPTKSIFPTPQSSNSLTLRQMD